MIWTFHEPGVIPGIPGTFAHCQVTVGDDGTIDIQPIAQQPHDPPDEQVTEEDFVLRWPERAKNRREQATPGQREAEAHTTIEEPPVEQSQAREPERIEEA